MGEKLKFQDYRKLLEVVSSNSVGHGRDVSKAKEKCQNAPVRLAEISSTILRASGDAIRCFDLALVAACLRYACPAWYGVLSATDLGILDSLQEGGARPAPRLPVTTNTEDSLLEADLKSSAGKSKSLTFNYATLASL